MIEKYDLLVVGGRLASQSAVQAAGRMRMRTALLNSEQDLSVALESTQSFLFVDVAPIGVNAVADAERYPSVSILPTTVVEIAQTGSVLLATLSDGSRIEAQSVVIATKQTAYDIPGLEEVLGQTVFRCPTCDGYELVGEPLALFAHSEVKKHVQLMQLWTTDIVVFSDGLPIDSLLKLELLSHGVIVEENKVKRLESANGKLKNVILGDGRSIARKFGFVFEEHPRSTANRTQNRLLENSKLISQFELNKIRGGFLLGKRDFEAHVNQPTDTEAQHYIDLLARRKVADRWNALNNSEWLNE